MSEVRQEVNDEEKQLPQDARELSFSCRAVAYTFLRIIRTPMVVASIALALSITETALFYALHSKIRFNACYGSLSILQDIALIITLVAEMKYPSLKTSPRRKRWFNGFKLFLWLAINISIIVRIVFLSSVNKLDMDDAGKVKSPFSLKTPPNIAYLSISILAIVVDCNLLIIWWNIGLKTYHIAFAFISMFQLCTGISEIQININILRTDAHSRYYPRICNMYVYLYTFLIVQSFGGFIILSLINEENRLSPLIGNLVLYYCVYGFGMFLFLLIGLIITTVNYTVDSPLQIPLSNPILLGCNLAGCFTILFIARHFRRRVPPAFQVEEYDFNELNDFQLEGFAKLMDRNFKYNGGINGKAAISLIKSYLDCDLPGMRTKLIRTYNTNKSNPSHTWDYLDKEEILFRARTNGSSDSATIVESALIDMQSYKPLLKNQLKKLQKKDKNKKNKREAASLELLASNSQEFYDILCNTEALTLLTVVEKYDLTTYIPDSLGGRYFQKFFGAKSKIPLLCIRFGLLGFHWPFRRSTFYCSTPKKPIARFGAVLYALRKWNLKLPRTERCRVLLDPIFREPDSEKAIAFSGWCTGPLPNGHIIDLRPYTNKTLEEYFKLVKYRVQDQQFKQDHGEVIFIDNPLSEDCHRLMELWKDIYQRREEDGQTSYLINPTPSFIHSMVSFDSGKHNKNNNRSLMFLKVGEEYVASCVIFRLGKTITSDIQGLNGQISKKYKAYFVMMQEVIRLALAEGKAFVDFGPTTEKPKVDIGCSVVPLVQSFSTGNPILNWIVQAASKNINV